MNHFELLRCEFHVAANNPLMDTLREKDIVSLKLHGIDSLFRIEVIDDPKRHSGILCNRLLLVQLSPAELDGQYNVDGILDAEIIE